LTSDASERVAETMADRLQELPAHLHWAMADESLLQAVCANEALVRGFRGRVLGSLVRGGRRLGLAWPLLWLVGTTQLIGLLIRQWMPGQSSLQRGGYPAHWFVGFRTGKEEELFARYCAKHSGIVGRLDQLSVASLVVWHRVGFLHGLGSLARALKEAQGALRALPKACGPWTTDFMTHAGTKAGYFAFMRAWFETLRARAGDPMSEVAFLSADTAAFAGVAAGLATCYLQHGMIRHSTLLPAFTRVEALTADEAGFMRCRLPRANVTLCPQLGSALTHARMAREILIASIYGEPRYISQLAPVVRWAADNKVMVRVRPHPCENGSFWRDYEAGGKVVVEMGDADIHQAMNRLRPRFMVSLFSTALLDALECGIIPVTVCADDDRNVADMVYPLFQRSLRWPRDHALLERALDDDSCYASVLASLRDGSGRAAA
jgi:hypothetical protein